MYKEPTHPQPIDPNAIENRSWEPRQFAAIQNHFLPEVSTVIFYGYTRLKSGRKVSYAEIEQKVNNLDDELLERLGVTKEQIIAKLAETLPSLTQNN